MSGKPSVTARLIVCLAFKGIVSIRPATDGPEVKGREQIRWPHERAPSFELPDMNQFVVP